MSQHSHERWFDSYVTQKSSVELLNRCRANGLSFSGIAPTNWCLDTPISLLEFSGERKQGTASVDRQLSVLDELFEPSKLHSAETYIVSSTINDRLAQLVAGSLFLQHTAFWLQDKMLAKHGYKHLPRWVRLLGSYDTMRKQLDSLPNAPLYVFTGCMDNSPDSKKSWLRDLVALTDNASRIIVTSEANPYDFAHQLRLPFSGGVYINSRRSHV